MREKILLFAVATLMLSLVWPAHAQQPKKVPRIGVLSLGTGNPTIDAFRQGLHELGWVDGKNIALEYRWAEGNEDRFPVLAAELLRINVDIILVTTPQAANAAKKLTKTIPIIVTAMYDPVRTGLVKSLGPAWRECNRDVLHGSRVGRQAVGTSQRGNS
jgi:putative ABC transport system substrate-binding protein